MTRIETNIGGFVHYVRKVSPTAAGYYVFELSRKIEDSHDFESAFAAAAVLEKVLNHHDRKFKVIQANGKIMKKPSNLFTADKNLK